MLLSLDADGYLVTSTVATSSDIDGILTVWDPVEPTGRTGPKGSTGLQGSQGESGLLRRAWATGTDKAERTDKTYRATRVSGSDGV